MAGKDSSLPFLARSRRRAASRRMKSPETRFWAADKRRCTRINRLFSIGVHPCSSAASHVLAFFQQAVRQPDGAAWFRPDVACVVRLFRFTCRLQQRFWTKLPTNSSEDPYLSPAFCERPRRPPLPSRAGRRPRRPCPPRSRNINSLFLFLQASWILAIIEIRTEGEQEIAGSRSTDITPSVVLVGSHECY